MNKTPGIYFVVIGQILLIVCCVFYLIWWSFSYRPGEVVNRVSGFRGILFLTTILAGIAGLFLSFFGMRLMDAASTKLSGTAIALAGFAAYFILFFITRYGLGRPVTTELVLIVGWTVLEIELLNHLNGAGVLGDRGFMYSGLIIAAAFLLSIILYVLYYRLEENTAFYAAMVPLISEGVSMGAVLCMLFYQ